MYEPPTKADLARNLSTIMHSAHQKARAEKGRLKSEFAARGMAQSTSLIGATVGVLNTIHQDAIAEAMLIIHDFAERMHSPAKEICTLARPHLENLGNSVLGELPPAGFPVEHQRIRAQYALVFQQRLDGALRDVEIGFAKGAGFARVEQMETKEEWIAAAEAARVLKPTFGTYDAQMTICKRAHSGMIRARAQRFIVDSITRDDCEIPKEFWWAEGHQSLTQNWVAGDFDTWSRDKQTHLQAFGVSFLRAEIEKLIPASAPTALQAPAAPAVIASGRPPADWWDDLWVEICRQLYGGELIPKKQGDIETAMKEWLAKRNQHPSDSTIRPRARKLWQAISPGGN